MDKPETKKPYEKPAILWTQIIEARSTGCAQNTSTNPVCAEGPIWT